MGLLAVGPGPKTAKSAGSGPIVPPPPTRWGTGVKKSRYRGTNVVRVDTRRCCARPLTGPGQRSRGHVEGRKVGTSQLGPTSPSDSAGGQKRRRYCGAARTRRQPRAERVPWYHGDIPEMPTATPRYLAPCSGSQTPRSDGPRLCESPRLPERLQVSKSVAITSPARTQHVCRRRRAESAPAATRSKLSTTRGAMVGQEWRLALAP